MRKAILAAILLLAACEGPAGPMGPAGPQGPPGPLGPTWFFGGQLNTGGDISIFIPAEAGTISRLPQVTCYIAEQPNGPWAALSDEAATGTFCGVARDSGTGQLFVFIVSGVPGGFVGYFGWYYQIIVRAQSPAS